MNKFFTSKEVYEERIEICKACVYYFKPSGTCKRCLCFMKVKARIAPMECPERYWLQTGEMDVSGNIPDDIVDEVLEIWKDIKSGTAKDLATKKKMIELHNTIFNTNFSRGTNCSSCLKSCYKGLKNIYEKYSGNN